MPEWTSQAEEYITPREAVALVPISAKTLQRLSDAGKIRTIRPGGKHRRYARADVEALLSPQSTPSSAVSPQDVPPAGEGVSSLGGVA